MTDFTPITTMDNFHRAHAGVATDVRGMTSADMVRAAGLDSPVTKEDMWLGNGAKVPNQFALVRNGRAIGTVGSKYVPWQDSSLFGVFDELLDVAGFRFHSAGSLHNGAMPWALAEIGEKFSIARPDGSEDASARFLFITHSHGSGVNGNAQTPLVISPMLHRFFCANQLPSIRHTSWRIAHTASSEEKVAQAMEAIRGSLLLQDEMQGVLQELADQRIAKTQVRTWAEDLLLDMETTLESVRDDLSVRKVNQVEGDADAVADLFESGKGNQGLTKYDALNGLSEWIDHHRESYRKAARNNEGRFKGAMFGKNGPELKRRGIESLRAL